MEFSSSSTNHTYKIQATDLRLDPDYQYYYISWARAIFLAFIPFLLLSILNGKIIYQLRKTEVHLSRVSKSIANKLILIILGIELKL